MDSTYEVLAVRYGTRTTYKSEVYLNFHTYGEPDTELEMDYFFWVVRNAERTLLVDTGFGAEVGDRRNRTMLCPPVDALAKLGLRPDDVTQVVLTHAHYDHIGNIGLFPNAEMHIARQEVEFWAGPYARRAQLAAAVEPAETAALTEMWRSGRLNVVEERATVAPGIELLVVGGHTPGQLIVLVSTDSGQVVLASDALHYYEEYERDRPFAVLSDLVGMYRAYDLLDELATERGCQLVAGHDPDVLRRFPPMSGISDVAVARIG
ncbi:glyoxylase-like metal-dependent hydrolase (beta-lactamase superfamily II) [Tamaricihabitans halophyticus]|uniref:Glyoxylase-like metal-dependent hydrolase (Beta-lactamase superfamily II) n=1 Tax=Tamaricihabitans halophyticus TaxID=1262583 RepID=A0A4R2R3U8_9PSEU|nr:N-acyl homoserine lactonase family protein [Tamaricihabitans halophyticus]TCP56399.1 glyoxylase-like metal-dependent hydrolase (beta-lactamase superfamily II) [Tamaricihabitans halophyticus]